MSQPNYGRRIALQRAEMEYLKRFAESPNTLSANRSALKAFYFFRAWLGRANRTPTPLENLDLDVLVEFRNWMARRHYAAMTRDNYVTLVKQYLRYALEQNALAPAFSLERAAARSKQARKRHSYPVKEIPDEMPRIIKFFDDELPDDDPAARLEHLRNRALMHTLYACAGRVSEIVTLTRKQAQDGRIEKIKVKGKGDKERFIFLTAEAMSALRTYCAARDDLSEWLFVYHRRRIGARLTRQGAWSIVNAAAAALQIPHVSPHAFRHYRARQMLEQGAPLDAIQAIFGHEDIGTTRKVYARTSDAKTHADFVKYTKRVSEL